MTTGKVKATVPLWPEDQRLIRMYMEERGIQDRCQGIRQMIHELARRLGYKKMLSEGTTNDKLQEDED